MYVTKIVYVEKDEIPQEHWETIKEVDLVQYTDYNTVEITADNLEEVITQVHSNPYAYDKTEQQVMDALNEGLGVDVVKALIDQDIDAVMVLYA